MSSSITRLETAHPCMSQAVVHNKIVYTSGGIDLSGAPDVTSQTKNILVMDSFVAASPVGGKDGKGSWGFLGAIVGLLLGFAIAFVRGPAK